MSNFDEVLASALSDKLDEEIEVINRLEKVSPSPKLRQSVLDMCNKKNSILSSCFPSVLKRCAVFALVFFSSVSWLLLTAPEVQGAVQQVILKWTDEALEFKFEGESVFPDAVSVNVSYLPDGYRLTDSFDSLPDMSNYTWLNNEKQEIYLSCLKISQGASQGIDNEHGTLTDIDFPAKDVVYLKSNTAGYSSLLSWTEEGYSMLLIIPETFSDEAVIKIAEGVELIY